MDTTDEWILRRSGIKERRISSNEKKESTTALATQASLKALEMAEISPVDLDMIVVGTVTPDRQFPSAACMIQKALPSEDGRKPAFQAGDWVYVRDCQGGASAKRPYHK